MASSGWQGQRNIKVYSSNVTFVGNLRIDSITHSGTSLRVTGAVLFGARGSSGSSVYYDNGVSEKPANGTEVKILPSGSSQYVGSQYDKTKSFDVTVSVGASATSYSFPVRYRAWYNASGTSTYWDVTINWSISFSPSGNPPTGVYIDYQNSTWDTITAETGVTGWGGLSGGNLRILVATGSVNGDAINASESNLGDYERYAYGGIISSSRTYNDTLREGEQFWDSGNPLPMKGLLCYRLFGRAENSVGIVFVEDPILRYLPPAPGQFSYSDPGGGGAKTYPVTFTGVVANNHTTYDAADLDRTVRYKIDNGNWVYVDNATVAALDSVTSFNLVVPAASTATVEGWMTYHGMQSQVETIVISNTNQAGKIYGSVNGQTKELVKLYGSVNGQTKKLVKVYASVGGVARKVYEDV